MLSSIYSECLAGPACEYDYIYGLNSKKVNANILSEVGQDARLTKYYLLIQRKGA